MKNLFNFAVTSRKSVKGTLLFSAIAISDADTIIGQFDINMLKEENNYALFLQYTPAESSDSLESISRVKLTGRDENEIREILESIPQTLLDSMSKANTEATKALPFLLMISMCIKPSTNSIIIPEVLVGKVNNDLICNILGGEWLGIEVKISPDVSEKLSYLTDTKAKKGADEKTKEEIDVAFDELMELLNNCDL